MEDGLNVIAFVKDGQRYVFVYDDDEQTVTSLLQTFGRYASDSELNFSWYDAAVMSQRVRRLVQQRKQEAESEGDNWLRESA